MLNTLYKSLATMLANKIKKVLPRIIGKDQKRFVDGRNISDAIRGLYDTICAANNKSLTGIMLVIDFFKAFDSISFSFIKAVLQFFKFSKCLIDWIMIMLRNFTVTIMHAGDASENINIGRGCRQGDPIAGLLFIICIEILLIMIRSSRLVKPFKITYKKIPSPK